MKIKINNSINEKVRPFQIVILFLYVYVLIALFIQLVFRLPSQINHILDIFDFLICLIFLYDFFYNFATAPNKLKYLKWGWIDFVSSIPTVGYLRVGRAIRIFRILRLLRAFKSAKVLITYLFINRAKGTFTAAALISIFLVIFASISILTFEDSPNSNIHSAIDAVWWSFSTISTTGSGDKFPVTSAGKTLSVVLAIVGIGLFGTFTAFIAKLFIDPGQKQEENEIEIIKKQLEELNDKIDRMSKSEN
jgi:voltage-gated potassium channel